MKKVLSVFMAIVVSVCHLSTMSVAMYDETDYMSLDAFTSKLVELDYGEIEKNTLSGMSDVYYSDSTEEKQSEEKPLFRLVAKASCKLDPLDSIRYIYGYNDLHILQFDNKESFDEM